ncbi:MAG: hypothetical protein NVS9B15_05740 [Acidobacteriaceae bacterium]
MSFSHVEKIANALLYEGYILYPYRSSAIKNQQRWNFGTLYPADFARQQRPIEASRMITECLVTAEASATLNVRVRLLQLGRSGDDPSGWEEGFEKSAEFSVLKVAQLAMHTQTFELQFPQQDAPDPQHSGCYFRQRAMTGTLMVSAESVVSGCYKLTFILENTTTCVDSASCSRTDALLQSFVSAHLLLGIEAGKFISLLDPEDPVRDAAARCNNVGAFPVLVSGDSEIRRNSHSASMMLSSPIILYDYPTVAPESAGDFFDATEMDEMLALRVMTLTDDEKHEMRSGDSRARAILERTESLPQEHLMKVHGAVRGMRKVLG